VGAGDGLAGGNRGGKKPGDLRRTHATRLLELSVHPKVVAERLGHTTIAMTMPRRPPR